MPEPGLRLYRFIEDGRLEYCRNDPGNGAARLVPTDEIVKNKNEERNWLTAVNDWMGKLSGKTVLIFGSGPQLRRITPKWIKHVARMQDVFIIGVNALPLICGKMWGAIPSSILDLLVAADSVPEHIATLWGWNKADGVERFRRHTTFSAGSFPMRSCSAPSLNLSSIYWVDSVTAAISVALIGLGTKWTSKKCGVDKNIDLKHLKRSDNGKIILIGVEHNKNNHAYTDNGDFYLCDKPDEEWPNMPPKHTAHVVLGRHAKDVGATILNAAPWSAIDAHDSCNVEDELGMSDEMRIGLSGGSIPRVGKRVNDIEYCRSLMRG